MNILLILNIDKNDSLEFATKVTDNNFIDLNNTFISVWLTRSKKKLCLRKISVGFDLGDLIDNINQCLNNKKRIPKELGKNADLGLLWNNHIQKIILAEEAGKPFNSLDWAGISLFFLDNKCAGFKNCNTFLYNDEQGNIIFETSAAYPWFFEDAPSPKLNISYNDWLPQYKILYKTTISREVAQEWIKQLNELYEKLDANMNCCKK